MSLFDSEKILTKVPAKNRDATLLAITYPNKYNIGMASLGFQTAWDQFNKSEDVKVIRWFTDIQEKSTKAPQYVGFSFSWELDYKNIFSILEKNNIPLHSKDRNENNPIVFCGGQVPNANPEPFCNNFDFFSIGDLEPQVEDLINKIIEIQDLSREEKLNEIRKLSGVYVPCRSVACYTPTIKRQTTKGDLTYSSILTPNCVWPNIFLLEVARSCPELCRFCLASYGSLPFRTPDVKDSLIPAIDFGLKHTNKIGLLGASVTQHPQFEELIDYLLSFAGSPDRRVAGTQVQIASIRADTISKTIAEGLFKLGAKSITMAVESGSPKLRDIINKKVSNETILNSIQTIYNAGFNSIKLYGMVGLPYETPDDLMQTIEFLKLIKSKNKGKKLTWSTSVFVPKATTPFGYFGVDPESPRKLKLLAKELHKIGVEFKQESYKWSTVQALISRGDRNINKVLELAYRYGGSLGSFTKAIKETGLESECEYFIYKNWNQNSTLPWENIQSHLNKEVVEEHTRKAIAIAQEAANIASTFDTQKGSLDMMKGAFPTTTQGSSVRAQSNLLKGFKPKKKK